MKEEIEVARGEELVQDHNWQAIEVRILTVGVRESHAKEMTFELCHERRMQRIETKMYLSTVIQADRPPSC